MNISLHSPVVDSPTDILAPPIIAQIQVTGQHQFTHICSPSGAVALCEEKILVADDEDNRLHLYAVAGGAPLATFDLEPFLELTEKDKDTGKFEEVDLEGATWLGDKIFWIGSHSQSKKGKPKPNRHRLFATEYKQEQLTIYGKPYQQLVANLINDPGLKENGLSEVIEKAAQVAPEPDGLNIEGLTSTPENHLLFGLRSPRKDGKAILIALKNPLQVVAENPQPPQFEAYLLDLGDKEKGGNGIRSIEYVADKESYLIIAGPGGSGGPFSLYEWAGADKSLTRLGSLAAASQVAEASPETLIVHARASKIQVLFDEGERKINGIACKDIQNDADKSFTGFWLAGL